MPETAVDLAIVRQGAMVVYRNGQEVARIDRGDFISLMQDMLAELRFSTGDADSETQRCKPRSSKSGYCLDTD